MSLTEDAERRVVAIEAFAATEKRRVRLAVPSGFSKFFGERLADLHREYPDITLELLSGSRPVDLSKGEAELAIRIGPVADEDLITRRVGEADWLLYASRAYLERRAPPPDPRHPKGHEILGYDTNLAAVPGPQWIERYSGEATVVLRSRELPDMKAAAVTGVGLAVLPFPLAEIEPALRRLTVRRLWPCHR